MGRVRRVRIDSHLYTLRYEDGHSDTQSLCLHKAIVLAEHRECIIIHFGGVMLLRSLSASHVPSLP